MSIEKAQKASVEARKVKSERIQDYRAALSRYDREHITLPMKPVGTAEQNIQLENLWQTFFGIQDRIKRLHTARGRATSHERKETFLGDLLAANDERVEIESRLRTLRRKMAGPEICAKVDLPRPHPSDFGLTPKDISE